MKIEDFEVGKIYKWVSGSGDLLFKYTGNRKGILMSFDFRYFDEYFIYDDGEQNCSGKWSEFTIQDKAEAL
jgi:hypothetical protein